MNALSFMKFVKFTSLKNCTCTVCSDVQLHLIVLDDCQ